MNNGYLAIIQRIANLNWKKLDHEGLLSLMVLSWYAAQEFAASLRLAQEHHPNDHGLAEMAKGELNTGNLQYGSYTRRGDHHEFLGNFIVEHRVLSQIPSFVIEAGERYLDATSALSPCCRITSVVSREQQLPDIFKEIQAALEKNAEGDPALSAYLHYIERHRELDSGDDGHAAKLSGFIVDDRVMEFWEIREQMYKNGLPILFQ